MPGLKLAHVYVLTADTYGTVTRQCEPLGITVGLFRGKGLPDARKEIVRGLGRRGLSWQWL